MSEPKLVLEEGVYFFRCSNCTTRCKVEGYEDGFPWLFCPNCNPQSASKQ